MARAGIKPYSGRLTFFPEDAEALADLLGLMDNAGVAIALTGLNRCQL